MSKSVFISGPLFSEAERMFLERMVDTLARASRLDPVADFFLPHRDGFEAGQAMNAKGIFDVDMRHLDSASTVVALLDGQDVDSGTCIELGYAYARDKKIFGILTDFRAYHNVGPTPHRPNPMVWGVCEEGRTVFQDLRTLAAAFAQHMTLQADR